MNSSNVTDKPLISYQSKTNLYKAFTDYHRLYALDLDDNLDYFSMFNEELDNEIYILIKLNDFQSPYPQSSGTLDLDPNFTEESEISLKTRTEIVFQLLTAKLLITDVSGYSIFLEEYVDYKFEFTKLDFNNLFTMCFDGTVITAYTSINKNTGYIRIGYRWDSDNNNSDWDVSKLNKEVLSKCMFNYDPYIEVSDEIVFNYELGSNNTTHYHYYDLNYISDLGTIFYLQRFYYHKLIT